MSMSDWSDDYQYDGNEMDMSQEHDFNEEDDVSMGFHEAQDDNITPRNFCLLPISDINPSVSFYSFDVFYLYPHVVFVVPLAECVNMVYTKKHEFE